VTGVCSMPTLVGQSSGARGSTTAGRGSPLARELNAVYARDRIEEVIRAIVEDALSPGLDVLPWHDEIRFETDLRDAIREITETTDRLLAERLTRLLESASPALVGRLASAPRFSDLA
jgi:hypothetical protein